MDILWAVSFGLAAGIVFFQQCDPLLPWALVLLTFTFFISHHALRTKHLPLTYVGWLTRRFVINLYLTKTTFTQHFTAKANHTHCPENVNLLLYIRFGVVLQVTSKIHELNNVFFVKYNKMRSLMPTVFFGIEDWLKTNITKTTWFPNCWQSLKKTW